MISHYRKPILTLVVMGLLVWFLPSIPIDPWNLLNLKKIVMMIFALTFIQVLGALLNRFFGLSRGALLTGFLGGLISSTATTAALAKKSKASSDKDSSQETLVFLAATMAMLFEGVVLVYMGTTQMHFLTLFIFVGPLLVTGAMIFFYSRKVRLKQFESEKILFEIIPILKLSLFIVAVLFLSKLLQNIFGQNGLMVLTFLVSLFEIHGSVIANIQLHEKGVVAMGLLNSLLAISIIASYLSKLFLISTLGSRNFRIHAFKCSLFLFTSLFMSWMISWGLSRL